MTVLRPGGIWGLEDCQVCANPADRGDPVNITGEQRKEGHQLHQGEGQELQGNRGLHWAGKKEDCSTQRGLLDGEGAVSHAWGCAGRRTSHRRTTAPPGPG